jgi:TonB family protein
LIPTVNSLLGLQSAHQKPLQIESSADGNEGIHRGPQYDAYLRDVKEAVKRNWKVSAEGESKQGTTVLRISINADGSLASLDLLQSCGMILHDYEALEAIKQSFPLRSPPSSLLDEHQKLSIRFSFHYFLTPPVRGSG